MATTKEDAVRELAEWHFSVEPDLKQVIRIVGEKENEPNEPIKLLEINAATVATGSVEAFAFGPSASMPFSTVIAEVTPEEFERIKNEELRLPDGWSLSRAVSFDWPGRTSSGESGTPSLSRG